MIDNVLARQQADVHTTRSIAGDVRRLKELDHQRALSDGARYPTPVCPWIAIGILMCATGGVICWALYGRSSVKTALAELEKKVNACATAESVLAAEIISLRERVGAHESAAASWERQN